MHEFLVLFQPETELGGKRLLEFSTRYFFFLATLLRRIAEIPAPTFAYHRS
jgi:hypothetical protein